MNPAQVALARARECVDRHIASRLTQGQTWHEETATDLLCTEAYPTIEYVDFNRRQENKTGSDWLWWWITPSGECFGLLIQAKNLKRDRGWSIDLSYNNREQIRQLLLTSDTLSVPAAYVLYCGDREYRRDLPCRPPHAADSCHCERAGVSIVPAMMAQNEMHALTSTEDQAVNVFQLSMPLEDLVLSNAKPIDDLNRGYVGEELRHFLQHPQDGPRSTAKEILRQLSIQRDGQFSVESSLLHRYETSMVFSNLPADRGHFGAPYFPHVLRGLRKEIPDYVHAIVENRSRPAEVPDTVAGIVLVHL